jgi:UDP-N-acetylglucosamine enolpyruvyl transferase
VVRLTGHILYRNCLLKHVIEGKIEVAGRQGRRLQQLLDDLKEMGVYWKVNEEALDYTPWRTHFGRHYGPVTTQTTE